MRTVDNPDLREMLEDFSNNELNVEREYFTERLKRIFLKFKRKIVKPLSPKENQIASVK